MPSKIEWTDETWNVTTGCTKVSAGCKNCYAERMTRRQVAMGTPKYKAGFDTVVCHSGELDKPLHWEKPRRIFVNSMSDLCHEDVPFEFVQRVFESMYQAPQHTYQVLTKRPARMAECVARLMGPALHAEAMLSNIWLGTSVENRAAVHRIEHLVRCPAAVRFLSLEPLLGEVLQLPLDGIDWLIVGCESGPGARPCKLEWVRSVVQQCRNAGVPAFVKQLNAYRCRCGHVDIAGLPVDSMVCRKCRLHASYMKPCVSKDPAEWPEDLRHQAWPEGVTDERA